MKQETIEKLLSSKNIDDVCIGIELTHKNYEQDYIYAGFLRKYIDIKQHSRTDIYVGQFNIVIYGEHTAVDVFPSSTITGDPGRGPWKLIRL